MFVVRYIALAVLAIWLGGMTFVLARGLSGQMLQHFHLVAYACGGTILVCLFVMKFMGPPPRAFTVRVALVISMILAVALSGSRRLPVNSTVFNTAIALVLLSWYARE